MISAAELARGFCGAAVADDEVYSNRFVC